VSLVLDAGGDLTLSVTGQPDFAHLVVDYVPGSWLLESKSLKIHRPPHRRAYKTALYPHR
jgi:hypothetical protein